MKSRLDDNDELNGSAVDDPQVERNEQMPTLNETTHSTNPVASLTWLIAKLTEMQKLQDELMQQEENLMAHLRGKAETMLAEFTNMNTEETIAEYRKTLDQCEMLVQESMQCYKSSKNNTHRRNDPQRRRLVEEQDVARHSASESSKYSLDNTGINSWKGIKALQQRTQTSTTSERKSSDSQDSTSLGSSGCKDSKSTASDPRGIHLESTYTAPTYVHSKKHPIPSSLENPTQQNLSVGNSTNSTDPSVNAAKEDWHIQLKSRQDGEAGPVASTSSSSSSSSTSIGPYSLRRKSQQNTVVPTNQKLLPGPNVDKTINNVNNNDEDDDESAEEAKDSFDVAKSLHNTIPIKTTRGNVQDPVSRSLDRFAISNRSFMSEASESTLSVAQTVASSIIGDNRQSVDCKVLTDFHGDPGTYTGGILRSSGMPHGVGQMIYKNDGRTYNGNWCHGRWHGHGKVVFYNGDTYDGEYQFNKRHGRGKYCYSDGRVYDGDFFKDQRQGKGVFTWPDGKRYEGDFKDGQRDGYGRYTFSNGGYYVGGWKNGQYEGYGECHWQDGHAYKGEWRGNKCNGRGVETDADGRVRFDGLWKDDKPC